MRAAIVVVGLCGSIAFGAMAQAPPTDSQVVDRLQRWIAPAFELDKLPPLDPELRRQGEAAAAEHLERLRVLLARWVAQQRAQLPAGAPEWTLGAQGVAWLVNELALWRVDSLGPEDDSLRRRMMMATGVCRHFGEMGHFAFLLVQLQTLPVAERGAALARERERLARWGTPRAALPDWPDPMPEPQLESALAAARRAEGRMVPPMAPVLADALVRDLSKSPLAEQATRCEAVRWWLQRQGDAPGALATARLALMPQPPAPRSDAPADPSGYPPVAARFGVQGRTLVTLQVDADGRAREARVTRREITVPGLQGQRPIAFETVFDAVSLARVASARFEDRRGQTHQLEFVWKLE